MSPRERAGFFMILQKTILLTLKFASARFQNQNLTGSHDSCSYSITRASSFSMGLDAKAKEIIDVLDARSAKDIVYRWSVTQSRTVKEQLESGIRYLDMRISYNQSEEEIHVVHGLQGQVLDTILKQVKEFVTKYPKEVILMDFNHYYTSGEDRTSASTDLLLRKMERYLGRYLYPRRNMPAGQLTLEYLWTIKKQILFFLATSLPHLPSYVWRRSDNIVSMFDKQTFQDPEKWIHFLTRHYNSRRPRNKFYVTQGIMQPHWIEVVAGQAVNATLRTWISETANALLIEWLKNRNSGTAGINIVIADFIESYGFVPTVLTLNSQATRI